MTDKEVIKALETCILGDCEVCNCRCGSVGDCRDTLNKHSLDLINRQQAVIEHLQGEREVFLEDIHHSADQINEQLEEIERLQNESIGKCELAICMRNDNNLDDDCGYCIDKAKSEAIKEFWEKLWELDPEIISKVVSFDLDELNNLIKETVGEENDNR